MTTRSNTILTIAPAQCPWLALQVRSAPRDDQREHNDCGWILIPPQMPTALRRECILAQATNCIIVATLEGLIAAMEATTTHEGMIHAPEQSLQMRAVVNDMIAAFLALYGPPTAAKSAVGRNFHLNPLSDAKNEKVRLTLINMFAYVDFEGVPVIKRCGEYLHSIEERVPTLLTAIHEATGESALIDILARGIIRAQVDRRGITMTFDSMIGERKLEYTGFTSKGLSSEQTPRGLGQRAFGDLHLSGAPNNAKALEALGIKVKFV